MQTLYLVQIWQNNEPDCGDGMGPTEEIVIQLSDLKGNYVANGHAGSWNYAPIELLKMLENRKLKFVGSLPNFSPQTLRDLNSFWVVTEPIAEVAKAGIVGVFMGDGPD